MKKAFFINGGIGRVLCALPALEYYVKNTDPDAQAIFNCYVQNIIYRRVQSSSKVSYVII